MRITVKTKLGLAFALVIVLSAITAWLGISNLASLNATLDRVVQGPAQRVIISQEMSEQLLTIVRAEKNLNLSNSSEEMTSFLTELSTLRPAFRRVRECEFAGERGPRRCQFHGIDLVGRHQRQGHRIRQQTRQRQFTVVHCGALHHGVEIGSDSH